MHAYQYKAMCIKKETYACEKQIKYTRIHMYIRTCIQVGVNSHLRIRMHIQLGTSEDEFGGCWGWERLDCTRYNSTTDFPQNHLRISNICSQPFPSSSQNWFFVFVSSATLPVPRFWRQDAIELLSGRSGSGECSKRVVPLEPATSC